MNGMNLEFLGMRLQQAEGRGHGWRSLWRGLTLVAIALVLGLGLGLSPASANLDDDHYDGNIFPLYAGNGAIVPPRMTLEQAIAQNRPTVLLFYVDDSRDCKLFSGVISQLEGAYGRAAVFIPVMADAIPVKSAYEPNEPGYYFSGQVPQTVIFDEMGTVRSNQIGNVPYETLDDTLREVFNLLPRTESLPLKRRPINELNSELVLDATP